MSNGSQLYLINSISGKLITYHLIYESTEQNWKMKYQKETELQKDIG